MITLVSCMKDEALFITEWVAWHLLCGFDKVMVFTNDCTDETNDILNVLARRYPVQQHDNPITEGVGPQTSAMALAYTMPDFVNSEWVLHCDADEFLRVEAGQGRVRDLIDAVGPADCISVLWRLYGDNDLTEWSGRPILEEFTACEWRPRSHVAFHKSLFRPRSFARATDHMPKEPTRDDVVLRNTAGDELPTSSLFHPTNARHRGMPLEALTWQNGFLAHYALRSRDLFLMKNYRGDGMARDPGKYHVNSRFWRRSNRNDVQDFAIVRHIPALRILMEQMRRDPDLVALEEAAMTRFRTRSAEVLTPEQIAEWTL